MSRWTSHLSVAVLLLSASCAGSATPSQPLSPVSELPFPADRGSSALTSTTLLGKDAESQSAGAQVQGNTLTLPYGSTTEYAVYRFNTPSLVDHVEVDFSGFEDVFLGIADYSAQRWRFSGPYAANQLVQLDPLVNVSPANNVYVAVVVSAGGGATVSELRLLVENMAPVADFVGIPANPDTPMTVDFDGGFSHDADGSIVQYEWDLDGSGNFEFDGGTSTLAQRVYPATGAYSIGLRVTDNGGDTDTLTKAIEVWPHAVPDAGPFSGAGCCMAIVDGNPAISYWQVISTAPIIGQLRFVRATDGSGSTWGTPVTPDLATNVDIGTSLAVINGNPAIAYHDRDTSLLKYVRAGDSLGTSWGAPVTPDPVNLTFNSTLLEVNGRPALSYLGRLDWGDCYVEFTRAGDAIGATWRAPVTVEHNVNPFSDTPSTVIVHGCPALAWTDYDTNLRYVRAIDPDGAAWPTPITVDTTVRCTLSVVNGNPALAYLTPIANITYRRAADQDGAVWGPAQVIDSNGKVAWMGGLAFGQTNGRPTLATMHKNKAQTSCAVSVIPALDADGSGWAEPLDLANAGDYADAFSLVTLADGQPALCYVELSSGVLSYIHHF